MPVTLLDAEATAANFSTVALPIGADPQPGDRRLARVTISSTLTFGATPAGWTKLQDQLVSGAGRVGIFERRITATGETAASVSLSSTSQVSRSSVTVRGLPADADLVPATVQAASTQVTLTAPSIATGAVPGRALLTWHSAVLSSGANTATWAATPAGMAVLAQARAAVSAGLLELLCSLGEPPDPSGARTADLSAAPAAHRTTSLYLAPASVEPVAALTGGGGIGTAGSVDRPAATNLSGGGGLSTSARLDRPATAQMSGGGALSVAASATRPATAVLSGGGELAASAGQIASATLTAGGGLGGGAQQDHSAVANLSAGGGIAAAATQHHRGAAATLSAGGGLGATGTRVHPATATLSAGGAIVSTGTRVKIGSAVLSGGGAIVMGYVLRTAVVSALLSGGGALFARATASAAGALNPTVWAVDPTTGRLKPLPHVVKLQVDDVTNDVGAVTLDYPVFGKNWALLRDYVTDERKLEVEVWLEGSRATRVVGRLDQRQGDDVTEGAVWSFSGTLITGRLDEGVVAPQPLVGETTLGADVEVTKASVTSAQWSRFYALGYRTTDEANTKLTAPQKVVDAVKANAVAIPQLADPKREAKFSAATPGAILLFLLQQCWGRGALTDLTVDFTATKDSAGVAWPEVLTAKWSPVTTTLLQVAQRLVELGLVEFTVTPDRVLRVWRFGGRGTNRVTGPRPVTLRRGQNLLEAGRRQGSRGAGSRFFVVGGEGAYTQVEDLNAQARLGGVVEVGSSIGNITEQGALSAAAQRTAAAGARGQDERTFALALGVGMPRPGKDLGVCDTVRVDTAGQLGTGRVAQWTVALDAGSQMPAAQVTTGDLIRSRQAALLKRLQDQQSGETVIGTSQPSEDRGVPAAPTGLVVGSAAFLEGADVYAAVTAGWAAVEVNTDGTATTDLEGYRVEWALASKPDSWNLGADVGEQRTQASWTTAPGTPIRVRVQARDRSGNKSEWSTIVTHYTEDDATPPPVPSAPTVSEYLGTVRIEWDGRTSAAADMIASTPDFDYVEVHLSTASNFTPVPKAPELGGTLIGRLYATGRWTVADLPYGVGQFARLVAVDIRGNRQTTPSAQGSATPTQLVQIDIGPNAIGRAQIIDGEIVNAKIGNLEVNDAKMMNVGIGKLTAGILSADMVVASVIRTATSGLRTEFGNDGIRTYAADGTTITVRIGSATGNSLFTGELRSAPSGRRFVMNPGGSIPDEIRFYRSGGVDAFGRIRSIDTGQGTGLNIRSGQTTGGLSAESLVTPLQSSLLFGDIENGIHRSRVIVDQQHSYISSPVVDISADRRYPADGNATGHRVSFFHLGTNGLVINNSLIEYVTKNDNEPWLKASFRDSGLVFGNEDGSNRGLLCAANNAGGFQQMAAAAFVVASGRDAKEDIHDARAILDPLKVIRSARARVYRYSAEKWVYPGSSPDEPDPAPIPVEAPQRVGVIAEELPEVLVHRGPAGVGDTDKVIDLGSQIGVLWGALGQIDDQQIRTVIGRVTLTSGIFLAGATKDLDVLWDEPPLLVPTGGIVTVHAGVAWLGKVTAVIVPGSLTKTGCKVRARFLAAVSLSVAQMVTIEPQALYLYTPPFEAGS